MDSKTDYTSEEFWKDAPDGATHCGVFKTYDEWFKVGTDVEVWGGYSWCSTVWIVGLVVENNSGYCNFIPRPKPSPVFTKAMSDAGELPRVGMECMVYNAELMNPEYEQAAIDFVGCHVIVYSSESCTERTCAIELVKFKPIDTRTDKEKALDDLSKMVGDCESDYGILQAIIDGKIHGVTWSGK